MISQEQTILLAEDKAMAQIDGRTAIIWSEEFGGVIRAQWALSVKAGYEIAAEISPQLSDGST